MCVSLSLAPPLSNGSRRRLRCTNGASLLLGEGEGGSGGGALVLWLWMGDTEGALNLWLRLLLMSASVTAVLLTEAFVVLGWPSCGDCTMLLFCCCIDAARATASTV